ncbi:MAG: tetratricopeptide repeat protein [Rhodospirillaceae bacterium]
MKKQKKKVRPLKPKRRPRAGKTSATSPRPQQPQAALPGVMIREDGAPALEIARRALARGQWAGALAAGRQALMLRPDDAEALNVIGIAAFHLGDAEEAKSLFETALAFDPDHLEARNNLGNVLRETGDFVGADQAYKEVLARQPDHDNALFNQGILLEVAGDFPAAAVAFRKVLARDKTNADAHFHLGNLAKAQNRLTEALDEYGKALKRRPDHTPALTNRGAVLQEMGNALEAAEAYRKAIAVDPDFLDAHYNLATLLQETGHPVEALRHYDRIDAIAPGHPGALVNRAYALRELGRTDDAVIAAERAAAAAPDYDKALVNSGDLYLATGQTDKALALAERYLGRHPGNTSMLALQCIAFNEAGDVGALGRLLDYDRLLRFGVIDPPDGYGSLEDFNAALARHVRTHPSLVRSPKSHATRNGRHSGELMIEPKGPVAGLEQAIHRGVADYRAALPPEAGHPFLAQRPEALALSVWGVVMEDRGHQVAHIHPAAWLSGVYYPEIPDVVRADDPEQRGWIEFGRPPDDFHATQAPKLITLRPENGLMILFPSYMYHRTVPFHAPVERLSVAFDVVALD